jgi:hypothetical protein
MTATGALAEAFAEVIHDADQSIGENRTYGEGIGPHDEDDQIDALVDAVRDCGLFDGSIYTAKSDASEVRYHGGQSADIVLERDGTTEYCEAKLFRFQKANEQPSFRGSVRSSIHTRTGILARSSTMSRSSPTRTSARRRPSSPPIIDLSTGLGRTSRARKSPGSSRARSPNGQNIVNCGCDNRVLVAPAPCS